MTLDAATLTDSAPLPPRVTLGPPGRLFWVVVVVALLAGLDANSLQSLGEFLWVAPLWLAIAGWWVLRFGWWVFVAGRTARPRAWLAWFLVPIAMGAVFFLTRTDLPADARLAWSRPAMDQVATEILAGGPADRSWIGLYPVAGVERLPNGLRFVVTNDLFGRWGFAYARSGQPAEPEVPSDASGIWCCDTYESIGDGWVVWYQEWD